MSLNSFLRSLVITALVVVAFAANAQPGGGRPCPLPPCPPPVPISGIEYLIGLGGLYGMRNLLKSRKGKDEAQ